MVAKRAIVGVLGNSHKLHSVVTSLLDAWKNKVAELNIGTYTLLLLCHAHMSFIYDKLSYLRSAEIVMFPIVRLVDYELRSEVLCLVILYRTLSICRYAVMPAIIAMNMYLVE